MTDPKSEHDPDLTGHPDTIGPYRVVKVLGQGGMGIVYAAEQTEPVRRRVALKLVRGSDRSEDIARRFTAERQALAVMEHPAIAQVYDAGVMEDGSPYFVMEYIEGTPIVEYCDANQLSTVDRLRMFIQVCSAIQHAHQKGVIHRDLKPGNILITEQAGTPLPKVIDFGIAKAMDIHLSEQTFVTQAGQIIGTPAYMAPEQADSDGIDIDTRADVYALGVILYELLVGRLPLDPDELGFLPFLAKLVMRQTNAPTPSARLITLADEGEEVASRRHTDIDHLKRDLRGDLDWVTMKAIEPERERRYETALALADDLNRHLEHELVMARPPSTKYRLEKFVRRNRGAVLAGVLALLALVGGTVTTAVGMVKASRAERTATLALAQAEQDATTSREVSEFLVGLFRVSEPGPEMGGQLTARELLDRGVERIEDELTSQPLVQARLMYTMGRAYRALGFFTTAEELHRNALTTAESVVGPGDISLVDHLIALADLIPHNASDPMAESTGPEVTALVERRFTIQSEHMEQDTLKWIESVSSIAWLRQRSGDFDGALFLLDSVRAAFTKALGPNSSHVLLIRDLTSRLHINEGRHGDAVGLLEELLADSTTGGPFWTNDNILSLTNNLANAYGAVDRYDDALAILMANVQDYGELADSSMLPDFEPRMWNLAQAYDQAGLIDEAIETWRQLMNWAERMYVDDEQQQIGYRLMIAGIQSANRPAAVLKANLDSIFLMIDRALLDPRIGEQARRSRNEAMWYYGYWIEKTGQVSRISQLMRDKVPDDPAMVAHAIGEVSNRLRDEGDDSGALTAMVQQLEVLDQMGDDDSEMVLRTMGSLQAGLRDQNPSQIAVIRTRAVRRITQWLAALNRRVGSDQPPEADEWNALCWQGALNGVASSVMLACERAVAEAPEERQFTIRDSRGLARALTGNLIGGAEDFEFYADIAEARFRGDPSVGRRRGWAEMLRAGRNPFTEVVLDSLRN